MWNNVLVDPISKRLSSIADQLQPAIQTALNHLGYKCWHSTLCFGDNVQCRRWVEAIENKYLRASAPSRKDFDLIFAGYDAVSADPPAFAFVEDLVAAYPEAKIILIERDEDEWYESFAATVQHAMHRRDLNFIADIDPTLIGPVRDFQRAWMHLWWKVRTEYEMRGKARAMYREHNRLVRAVGPKERLLEYRLGQGWLPLCEFLGKDVPSMPFPSLHDRALVKARYKWIKVRGLQIVLVKLFQVLTPVGVCAAAWFAYQRYYLVQA